MRHFINLILIFFVAYPVVQASTSTKLNLQIKHNPYTDVKRAIASVNRRSLSLCKRSSSGEIEDKIEIERPTSDHDILVHFTQNGIIATWNILNPDSPVSPGYLPADHQGRYEFCSDYDKHQHIQDVAFTIGRLFAAGVDAIALQEIPATGNQHFSSFVRELNNASYRYGIEFDMPAFFDSLYRTKKANSNDYHGFSMGLLLKAGAKLSFLSAKPRYNERAVEYELLAKKSNYHFHLLNVHGDYINAVILSDKMKEDLGLGEGRLIVGDMNIPLSNKEAMATISTIKGTCVLPSMNRKDTEDKSNTLDCIFSEIKPSFTLVNGRLKNYASP